MPLDDLHRIAESRCVTAGRHTVEQNAGRPGNVRRIVIRRERNAECRAGPCGRQWPPLRLVFAYRGIAPLDDVTLLVVVHVDTDHAVRHAECDGPCGMGAGPFDHLIYACVGAVLARESFRGWGLALGGYGDHARPASEYVSGYGVGVGLRHTVSRVSMLR